MSLKIFVLLFILEKFHNDYCFFSSYFRFKKSKVLSALDILEEDIMKIMKADM